MPDIEGEHGSRKQSFWWLLTVAEAATGQVRTLFVRGHSADVVRAKGRELIEDHEVLASVQLY